MDENKSAIKKWELIAQIIALLFITLTTFVIEPFQDKVNEHYYNLSFTGFLIQQGFHQQNNLLLRKIDKDLNLINVDNITIDYEIGDKELENLSKMYREGRITKVELLRKQSDYYKEQFYELAYLTNKQNPKFIGLYESRPKCLFSLIDCRNIILILKIIRVVAIIFLFGVYITILRRIK